MRDYLKKSEFWGAMILLAVHAVLLPVLVEIVSRLKPDLMSAVQYNALYYCISITLTAVLLGRFLRRGFDSLLDNFGGCVKAFLFGWLIFFALAMLSGYAMSLSGVTEASPNDQMLDMLINEDRGIILALSLFVAPVVEECIFRGGIFCGLYRKNRILAYTASILLFAVYHIWQYVAATGDFSYLIYILSYIPASFVLCWVYEKSGSIWTSIFFHICNNLFAFSVMMQ